MVNSRPRPSLYDLFDPFYSLLSGLGNASKATRRLCDSSEENEEFEPRISQMTRMGEKRIFLSVPQSLDFFAA
jgi:hypothetical protein